MKNKMVGVEVALPKVVVAKVAKWLAMVVEPVVPCKTILPEPRILPVMVKAWLGELVPMPTKPEVKILKILVEVAILKRPVKVLVAKEKEVEA